MQNSALAVVLAQAAGAPPLAALPGALSAVTHSCLGSLFAAYWRILNVTGRTPGDYGVRDDGSIYEI
jgi:predicted Na+-dependent transporter